MDRQELLELIKTGEGFTLELKESIGNSLGKEICAFANASGGKIILGVKDNSEIIGYTLTNKEKSQISDIAWNMNPAFSVSIEQYENLAVITVSEGNNKPYSVSGHFYLRIGANSQQLNRDEIKDFFQIEGLVVFDEKLNKDFNVLKDLNKKAYDIFLERANIKTKFSPTKLLSNLGFIKDGIITNAGVLFFCKDISKFFLNTHITCVLFQGNNKAIILDKCDFKLDLMTNYEKSIEYLKSKLNTEYYITFDRKEFLELPEDALREAVLNAIAHRDYFSPAHIQLNIFQDRIEIVNPASFPSKITIDFLMSGSYPKNKFLFSMMLRADLIEHIGSGIERIKEAMLNYKLEEPIFQYDGVWFKAIFKRPNMQTNNYQKRFRLGKSAPVNASVNASVKLSALQLKVLKEIQKNNSLTYGALSEILKKDKATIRRNIQKLKQKRILKRVGSDKNGFWEITNA
ncbi:putative DNA binding domain-containing protein [bacterium]|nr:putative DNA binding domain-containing protein [bacterium]